MALFQFPTTFQCISLHTNDRTKIDVDNSEREQGKGVDREAILNILALF